MKRTILSAVALSLLASIAQAAPNEQSAPGATLSSGIAREFMEPTVRAQDDFFAHVNGKWLKETEIPADKASWGSFHKLHEDTQPLLLAIIENAAKTAAAESGNTAGKTAGSTQQKIGDLYASFMNEATLEQLGAAPLQPTLARIDAIKSRAELPALFAQLGKLGVALPYEVSIHQDAKDSTRYVADLKQSGLGLPDRDYYLKKDDKKLAEVLAKYTPHVERMLTLSGDAKAGANAKAVVAFETALARIQWTNVQLRDPVKAYNKVPNAKLGALAPGHDWKAYLAEAGISDKVDYVIVSQPSYLKALTALLAKTPLETVQAYLRWQVTDSYAPYLSKAFVDQNFSFYENTVRGVPQLRPRWQRGVLAVEANLGEALGQLYVAEHFPAERKARMEQLVANLLAAYQQSIDQIDWMSPATKRQAKVKLAKFVPKIGYPNKWKDYSQVEIKPDDLVGNLMRARAVEYGREMGKLGKPVDRDEWFMSPQTINAYYNPEMNEIVFPAAILQPPFFDAAADDAVNYGAIGAVIGHEISHGFDDQGSQYDGDGNLRNWWTKSDHKNFKARTGKLVKQYGSYAPLPGYHVNGELTLGENIADNSGLSIAYKAYQLSLGGKPAPVIDGFSGQQRFFMGFAQVWRSKKRENAQIVQIKSDEHAPEAFRANGSMKNQPGFYEAFKVQPGDKMYLPPKERVSIW